MRILPTPAGLSFLLVSAILGGAAALAQEAPTIIQIEAQNYVGYVGDVSDVTRLARTPGPVPPTAPSNFHNNVILADIVRVNGAAAKGVIVIRTQTLLLNPAAGTGAAIADVVRAADAQISAEILTPDGATIGSLHAIGLSGGTPAPGSPSIAANGSTAIIGGTGAFIGARGTFNSVELINSRSASQAEDPSRRRANGGGNARFVLQVIPLYRPEVLLGGAAAPEIFHADERPVTEDNPAKAGEELTLLAKGLGPTRPGSNLGEPFPTDQPAVVSSPVEVLLNGEASAAIDPIGLPGAIDRYRLRFRVPENASAGTLSVQLSAAWTKGAAVRIPIQ